MKVFNTKPYWEMLGRQISHTLSVSKKLNNLVRKNIVLIHGIGWPIYKVVSYSTPRKGYVNTNIEIKLLSKDVTWEKFNISFIKNYIYRLMNGIINYEKIY